MNDGTFKKMTDDIRYLKAANSDYEAALKSITNELRKKKDELDVTKHRAQSQKKKLNSMNNLDINDQRIVNLTNIILDEIGSGKIDLSVVNKINDEVVNYKRVLEESRISEEQSYQDETEISVLCDECQGHRHNSNDSIEHLTDYETNECQNPKDEGLIYGMKEQVYALKAVISRLEEDCRRKDLDNVKMGDQCDKYKKRLIDLEDMMRAPNSVQDHVLDDENLKLKEEVNNKDQELEDLKCELANVKKILTENKIVVNFDDPYFKQKHNETQPIKGMEIYNENAHKNIDLPDFRKRDHHGRERQNSRDRSQSPQQNQVDSANPNASFSNLHQRNSALVGNKPG